MTPDGPACLAQDLGCYKYSKTCRANFAMTDDTPDLTLLGRRIEKIESDLRWTREALEDMAASLGRRLTAIEASQRALEDRVTTLETRAVSTIFARLRAQIEEVPLLPRQINEAREHFEELGRLLAIKRPVWPYREPDPYPDGMPIEP
jgi:hypothetical protein